MGKETIELLVEGGKATASPPLGPTLAPLKVNIGQIVAEINRKTADMAGMKVPVKVTVDTGTKEFEIDIGTPPVSALIKKEIGIEKGSSEPGKARVGDITEEQIKKIAKIKFGSDERRYAEMIKGTAKSMGVSVGQGKVTEEEIEKEKTDKEKISEDAAETKKEAVKKEG